MEEDTVAHWIELLCGQSPTLTSYSRTITQSFPATGLGRSQLNELLLAFQLDRVGEGLFEFIFKKEPIDDFDTFKQRILEFRKLGALRFGNFKYAFKHHREMSLQDIQISFQFPPNDLEAAYRSRHSPVVDLQEISPTESYYLGYIVEREIQARPNDAKLQETFQRVRAAGQTNHEIYLDYDHLDVYIATSMRAKFDFWNVARFSQELQEQAIIRDLRLRFFDPTQAYCKDRIDKGLVEGLMLRRARCTIYLAGESETLGKDSELAATLAQGKTVIAYLPLLDDFDKFRTDYAERVFNDVYPDEARVEVALRFLQLMWPEGAWVSNKVRGWLSDRNEDSVDDIVREIFDRAKTLYDSRATTLKVTHPLGLQVHLDTGVANGVLVARTVPECAELIKRVVLERLEFDLVQKGNAYALVEKSTGSIHRVVSQDSHLTNSFWNFYKL